MKPSTVWDSRYDCQDFIFGIEPNNFLSQNIDRLIGSNCLTIGEGEGRNAVFLATHGFSVMAVDVSSVGLNKLQSLAHQKSVSITTECADLEFFDFGIERWDSIISIYCHLPLSMRAGVYKRLQYGLKKGGVLLIEGYSCDQPKYGTGGPSDVGMLLTTDILRNELDLITFEKLEVSVKDVIEGSAHTGMASVVSAIGVKR